MKKVLKKIWFEIYWRKFWWFFYSRRTTWGVQWYSNNKWKFNPQIEDKVFFRKEKAEKFWDKIKYRVRKDEIACLWRIDKGNYIEELETVNY